MDWQTTSTVLEKLGDFDQQTAWSTLHEHFRGPIERFAVRLGLGSADAQDAAQETLVAFAEAYRKGHYDRSKGRLKSWLFGIAHRTILDQRRRLRRRARPAADFADTVAALEPEGQTGADPSSLWEEEWRRSVYERALLRVQQEVAPETYRIFAMVVIEGRPVDEIASELGILRTKVYNARFRVTKRLTELAREYDDA